MKKLILITLVAITSIITANAATYNFIFNNTEQGNNSTATPNVTVNGEPIKVSSQIENKSQTFGSNESHTNTTQQKLPKLNIKTDFVTIEKLFQFNPSTQLGIETFEFKATPNLSKVSNGSGNEGIIFAPGWSSGLFMGENGKFYNRQGFTPETKLAARLNFLFNRYLGIAGFYGNKIYGGEVIFSPFYLNNIGFAGFFGHAYYQPVYQKTSNIRIYDHYGETVINAPSYDKYHRVMYTGASASLSVGKHAKLYTMVKVPIKQGSNSFIVEQHLSGGVAVVF